MKIKLEEVQRLETQMLHAVGDICHRHHIEYFLAYGTLLGAVRHQGPIPWDSDVDILVPHHQVDRFVSTLRRELPQEYYIDYYDTNKAYPLLFPRVGVRGYSTRRLHIDVFIMTGAPMDKKEQSRFYRAARLYYLLFKYKNFYKTYMGKYNLKQTLFVPIIKILLTPLSNKRLTNGFKRLCHKYPYHSSELAININGEYGMKEISPKEIYGKGRKTIYANEELIIPEQYDRLLQVFYGDYRQLPPESERATDISIEVTTL